MGTTISFFVAVVVDVVDVVASVGASRRLRRRRSILFIDRHELETCDNILLWL